MAPLPVVQRKSVKEQLQEKYETLWQKYPDRFAVHSALEKERLDIAKKMVQNLVKADTRMVELGCGAATLTRWVAALGATVDAVDVALSPLKKLEGLPHIATHLAYVPYTPLEENRYTVVIATELLASLPRSQQPLLLAEIVRLLDDKGVALLSTPLDIHHLETIEQLQKLVMTQFEILNSVFLYNSCYIKLLDLVRSPQRFAQAMQDPFYLQEKLAKRRGIARFWFRINSLPIIGHFWAMVTYLVSPIKKYITNNSYLLLRLAQVTKAVGIGQPSHATLLLRKKRLLWSNAGDEL